MDPMQEALHTFAMGLFPAGCKFYNGNDNLSMGGELLSAIIIEKSTQSVVPISPCDGCAYYKQCKSEGRFAPRENRLSTDNLDTRRLTLKEMENAAMFLMSNLDDTKDWTFNPDEPTDVESGKEIPFILCVIRKRIMTENLKLQITKKAYLLMLIMSEGVPGKAMFILHKAGNLLERGRTRSWLVTASFVTSAMFPFGVPTEKAFSKWWEDQKVDPESGRSHSDNLVDVFPDEWRCAS